MCFSYIQDHIIFQNRGCIKLGKYTMADPQIFDVVFEIFRLKTNLKVSPPLLLSSLRVFRRYYEVINNFFRCGGLDLRRVIHNFLDTLFSSEIRDSIKLATIPL